MARWTKKELEILKLDISVEEMMIFLPGRTRIAIMNKKTNIGKGEKNVKIWEDEEIEIIKRDIPIKEMVKLLPHRTRKSIYGKRTLLGINPLNDTRRKWSEEDLKILKDGYPFDLKEELMKKLDRTWSSIVSKAHALKIERKVEFH